MARDGVPSMEGANTDTKISSNVKAAALSPWNDAPQWSATSSKQVVECPW